MPSGSQTRAVQAVVPPGNREELEQVVKNVKPQRHTVQTGGVNGGPATNGLKNVNRPVVQKGVVAGGAANGTEIAGTGANPVPSTKRAW